MVRPHIEYANQVWHPRRLQDVKYYRGKKLTYENRLRKLKLPTLTYRQVRGDKSPIGNYSIAGKRGHWPAPDDISLSIYLSIPNPNTVMPPLFYVRFHVVI